jgi:glycosyltransferase involved in cell wall biosynthesis
VASVAQLLPVKGQDVLIRAIADRAQVHLLLAGSALQPAYAEQLRELAAGLGVSDRVHFLGNVSDVPALAAEVDIFVLATLDEGRREGSPVALLEAMSSGLPCIATDVPGSQDIVQPGESGLLVPPGDHVALAAALATLADRDTRRRLGEAARRRSESAYAIEREAADHARIYEDVMRAPAIVVPRLPLTSRSSLS